MPGVPDRRPGQGANFQPKTDYKPQTTPEQLGVMINGGVNKLLEAIKQGNTEHLTSYLAFSSRLWKYSPRNQQLIYEQFPAATRCASYATWKAEGFQVRKMQEGEHGIKILVPIPPAGYKASERRSQRADEMQKDEKDLKTVGFITTRFKVGSTFDVKHLIPEDQARVPKFFRDIEGDHDEVYQKLLAIAKQDNIRVIETLDTEGSQGKSGMGIVLIRPDIPSGNKASTLAHELIHEYEHDIEKRRNLPKQIKECHAEAGAFIVMQACGITIPYSGEYLRNWGNDEKTLRQQLDVVTSAASKLIGKLNALELGEKELHNPEESN